MRRLRRPPTVWGMNRAVEVVTTLAVFAVGVWVVATSATTVGEVVLYSLLVLAVIGTMFAQRALRKRSERRAAERGQSRHAWLFFLVLGPVLAAGGVRLLVLPHSDEAGGTWPFGTTSLGVVLLVTGVGGLVYAFVMRAQRDRQGG